MSVAPVSYTAFLDRKAQADGAALRLLDPSGRRFWLSKVEHV